MDLLVMGKDVFLFSAVQQELLFYALYSLARKFERVLFSTAGPSIADVSGARLESDESINCRMSSQVFPSSFFHASQTFLGVPPCSFLSSLPSQHGSRIFKLLV
jgi:hypothetical protein